MAEGDQEPQSQAPMALALERAREAFEAGDVPVGAVITDRRGAVIAATRNAMHTRRDPTAHAEMLAIREACTVLDTERLVDCDLYVTLEPCAMCAAAISYARIRRLYYGAEDVKHGGVDNGPRFYSLPTCHHAPEVYGGLSEAESADLMKRFFAARRR